MKFIFALFLLIFSSSAVALHAQTSGFNKIQKSNKTLVSIPVVVSDQEGRYIPNLKKDDFTVYQDGVKQDIDSFSTYNEPIKVALLLDTSGSTKDSLIKIKRTANDFIKLLNPNDQCLLATFDSKVNVLNSFTADQKVLEKSLDTIQNSTQVGSVMRRALAEIVQKSFKDVEGRKVIILISDGKDFGSFITPHSLLDLLEESDTMIYTIFYKTEQDYSNLAVSSDGKVTEREDTKKRKKKPKKKKKTYSIAIPELEDLPSEEEIEQREKNATVEGIDILKKIADTTAGRFYVGDVSNMNRIFKEITSELGQQYRLGYYTKDAGNEITAHDIKVTVDRPDAVVRSRGKFRAKQLQSQ